MKQFILMIITAVFIYFIFAAWQRWKNMYRANYIRQYMFPPGLLEKLGAKHPDLTLKDKQLVARALRQFFLAHLRSGRQFVSMPSQVVDDLWHEFILYTRHYEQFCDKAFGRFMHHTPAVVLGKNRVDNTGLRRIWWFSCLEENINPRAATRLPLLFSLDEKLNISKGFHYALDCAGVKREGSSSSSSSVYCGGDMSDSSFDGSTDGFGDSTSDASGSDSGDGSGGCGGGCGGGGD